jgi:stage II sporulation protein D
LTGPAVTRRLGVLALLAGGLVTCAPQEAPEAGPTPEGRAPEIRVGLATGAARVTFAGDSGLSFLDGEGAALAAAEPGSTWQARASAGGFTLAGPTGWAISGQPAVTVGPRQAGGIVLVNGKGYRGTVQLSRDRSGLTVINRVGMEDYLTGVLGAEMGRRDSADAAALAAQAIVSRTFAIRNLGKRATEGFDLYATVADQVYGGVGAEYPLARWAVQATAGQIVSWQGLPIDAFFFSTCGGRTATGTEVFAAADRPYLQSVVDTDPEGQSYCRISPRYRWREEWTGAQLDDVLQRSLPPAAAGVQAADVAPVQGVSVTRRTGSDRVARLSLAIRRGTVTVEGPAVRQVLRPVGEASLRSAVFQLIETRAGARLAKLVAEGGGAGHGVGFCQWGAVGRARAGQDAVTILRAYFPGTELSRAY